MNFCSYVLLSKKSKHPLNIASANDAVIPGKDQGSYLNDSTNACDKSKTHPTSQYHQIPGPSQE